MLLRLVLIFICLSWVQVGVAEEECRGLGTLCHEIQRLSDNIRFEANIKQSVNSFYVEEEYCHRTTRFGNAHPFHVRFSSTASYVNGQYQLTDGNKRLPVTVEWKAGGSGYQRFIHGGESTPVAGSDNCNRNNAAIRVSLTASAVEGADPGEYEGEFGITPVLEGFFGDYSFRTVSFSVTVPPLVRISRLNDMTLTQRNDRNNGYEQDEWFCVFSQGSAYTIAASGGPGATDPFQLRNGNERLDYQVLLSTRNNGNRLREVQPGEQQRVNRGSRQLSCGGQDNARAQVQISDRALSGKPVGTYRGVLYLTVEPA